MSQQAEQILNGVLIEMARSLLQYVAEAWPWVDVQKQSIEDQVLVLAARQRQDVSDIVEELNDREHPIDFGTFPTEYTDLQFLSLGALFDPLLHSQKLVAESLDAAIGQLSTLGDTEAAQLLQAIKIRQAEITTALGELQQQLTAAA